VDSPFPGLKVSQRQFIALEELLRRDFIARAARHVRQFFPKHAAALSAEQLDALIEFGIERGAAHGIVAERDVCKLVDLMVAFGPLFETDKQHPWAARILLDAKGKDPTQLVNELYDAGLDSLKKKPGFGNGAR
jgi:hypothetical protein